MARSSALAVVAEAVAALFSEARPPGTLFSSASYVVVGQATITATSSADPTKLPTTGVTVFPYRVAYNAQRRPAQPRVMPDGSRFRPSLLVDLHLLINAWAPSGADQMRLLGWAARTIEDSPVLGPGLLNRWSADGETVFGPSESVELVAEPLSLQDLVAIWEINLPCMQASLGYVARMIALDSEVKLPDQGLVRSRNFDHGVMSS